MLNKLGLVRPFLVTKLTVVINGVPKHETMQGVKFRVQATMEKYI